MTGYVMFCASINGFTFTASSSEIENPVPVRRADNQAFALVLIEEGLQVRHRLAAGRTPCRPEIHQYDFAAQFLQCQLSPCKSVKVKSAFWRAASAFSNCAIA
jgi:hypothetical protein